MAADQTLWATATDDYWIDTGVPSLYLQANLDIVNGRRRALAPVDAIAAAARLGADVSMNDVVIGEGATVADGAFVSHSVVLDGANIGAGATVSHSVVMGHIGAGALVQNCIVGADGVVNDGETRADERIPAPIG
jgi:NDP-sugar pyrophosphorylase family protein